MTTENKMKVLVACEYSGTVRDAFAAKGHYAVSCDLLPTDKPNGNHYQGSVFDIIDNGWDLMIAHPPCTYLTVTGNKWFKPEFKDRFPERHKHREEALQFFIKLFNCNIPKVCLENPVGYVSTAFRKPMAERIATPYPDQAGAAGLPYLQGWKERPNLAL